MDRGWPSAGAKAEPSCIFRPIACMRIAMGGTLDGQVVDFLSSKHGTTGDREVAYGAISLEFHSAFSSVRADDSKVAGGGQNNELREAFSWWHSQ